MSGRALIKIKQSNIYRIFGLIFLLVIVLIALTFVCLLVERDGLTASVPLLHYAGLSLLLTSVIVIGIHWGAVSLRFGKLDLLELPVWYSLWTLGGLVLFGFLGFVDKKYLLPVIDDRLHWLPSGLWLPIVGISGLWLGYFLGWRLVPTASCSSTSHNRPKPKHLWGEPRIKALWMLYGLIWLERLWRISKVGTAWGADITRLGDLLALNQWFIYLEQSVYLVVAITALQVFRGRWSKRILGVILVLELSFIFITGFIKPVLWLALILIGASYYTQRELRIHRRALAAIVLIGLILIPMALEYRVLIASGVVDNRSLSDIMVGIGLAFTRSWGSGTRRAFRLLIDKICIRQAKVAETLGVIVHLTPSHISYWGVEWLLATPLYVIPRALWLEKPILSRGVYFNILYLGAPHDTRSSAAFTVFGDLYMSAGWPAVFLGMMLLGWIAALLYRHLVVQLLNQGQVTLTAFYIGLAVMIMDVEGSYVGNMVGLIQRFVVFGILFWLLHRRYRVMVNRKQSLPFCQRSKEFKGA
jgi:hypothetical protein